MIGARQTVSNRLECEVWKVGGWGMARFAADRIEPIKAKK